ncbi:hypothetical protein [Falsirhodobacter deserti]|uniref:hypothetical protein n=1 Tax=Falsirhodobacter deserti TaxID=1365611 RepID=UPI001F4E2B9A|nr:hypothetical protein [Falsirhodobacter deserti]
MKALFALPLMAALAACATPQERCIDSATRDLRVVDRLIAQGERTLSRGYGIEQYQVTRPTWRQCGWYPVRTSDGRIVRGAPRMCWEDEIETRERAVAVNLDEEARTLKSLREKRNELIRRSNAAVAQCQASFPETR